MRNHIVFKFIAVILCAACLLGAVGSGLGIFALTSLDLYDKSVDQVYRERVSATGQRFADELAMEFSSKKLGGFTDDMLESVMGSPTGFWRSEFEYSYFGYALKDYEGNVLESQELNYPEGAVTYLYDISGQYMYLVDVIPESEKTVSALEQAAVNPDDTVLYDAVPPEGAAVGMLDITLANGEGYGAQNDLGVVFYNQDGILQFHCVPWAVDFMKSGETVTDIQLWDRNGEILYHAHSPAGVGRIDMTGDGHAILFTASSGRENRRQEPNGTYEVFVNKIPAEGADLSQIQISDRDSSSGASGDNLGSVFCNQEGVVLLFCPGWDLDSTGTQLVTHIALYDMQGVLIYEARSENGVGTAVYSGNNTGDMLFTSFRAGEAGAVPSEASLAAAEPVPAGTGPSETLPESTSAAEPEPAAAEAAGEEASEEADTSQNANSEEKKEPSEDVTSEEKKEPAEDAASEEKKEPAEDAASEEKKEPAEDAASGEKEKASEEKQDPSGKDKPAEAAADKADAEEAAATVPPEVTQAPTEATVPQTLPQETEAMETLPEETEPLMINGKSLKDYQINRTEYYDSQLGEKATAKYVYVPMPAMTLELYIAPGALRYESAYTLLRSVQAVRGYLLPALGICLLLFAALAVYLCCAAGRNPKTSEVRAGGLNRLPIDGYLLLAGFGICACIALIAQGGENVLQRDVTVGFAFLAGLSYLACLLFVGFCFAFVAQIKTPGHFWWDNSLCGRCFWLCGWLLRKSLDLCVLLEKWMAARGLPGFCRLCKWVWGIVAAVWRWFWNGLKRCYLWLYNGFSHFYDLLPMTWQWILTGSVMVLFLFITLAGRFEFGILLAVLLAFALVLYGANCFGTLQEATRKMNRGDLNAKADDRRMIGAFRDFAHDLNDLADVAVVAAQKQLKSERMKTELITNVSHDIKTPLTSIINYVDLLQKPHTEEEGQEYLEVLERQSQRLKKLIEDLMDMSKASTGNMTVDITEVDAVESVNQALGEFADKLDKVQITPIFRHTETTAPMLADGRLVWRVLSNLLGNAVKYAMPGTRLYIDLMCLEGQVVISLKNISRDELNVDAEELMERFVRGDDSRNTEGSGLGLNIAKSLMELQKGQLQLLVDGDLFKVTLIFPGL